MPAIAKKYGLKVTAGTYLDHRDQHNDDEIAALIELVRDNDNIDQVLVGNETLLRNDMSTNSLIDYLDRVRAQVKVPVSTAEPWHIWEKYPQLARHVDFITTHLLPYWEKFPRKDAIGLGVLARYDDLQKRFPGRRILIGEVGWPSAGDRKELATPSIEDESQFLRQWVQVAAARNIDYFIVEAFDQPWKQPFEGRVGSYWGVFNADRQPKFAFTGTVTEDPSWPWKAAVASLLALLPMFFFRAPFHPLPLARPALLLRADPALRFGAGVVGDAALRVLSRSVRLGDADRAVSGAVGDHLHPADQRIRVHRSHVAAALDARVRLALAAAR